MVSAVVAPLDGSMESLHVAVLGVLGLAFLLKGTPGKVPSRTPENTFLGQPSEVPWRLCSEDWALRYIVGFCMSGFDGGIACKGPFRGARFWTE